MKGTTGRALGHTSTTHLETVFANSIPLSTDESEKTNLKLFNQRRTVAIRPTTTPTVLTFTQPQAQWHPLV